MLSLVVARSCLRLCFAGLNRDDVRLLEPEEAIYWRMQLFKQVLFSIMIFKAKRLEAGFFSRTQRLTPAYSGLEEDSANCSQAEGPTFQPFCHRPVHGYRRLARPLSWSSTGPSDRHRPLQWPYRQLQWPNT